MALMELRDLHITYRSAAKPVYAVRDFSISIEPKQALGIVGESGSGKSTIALGILGLLPSSCCISGRIYFQGVDLLQAAKQQRQEIRWKQIAAVFQKSMNSFSPVHTIGKTLTEVYRTHHSGICKTKAYDAAENVLYMVNLPKETLNQYPFELSGGMQQRAAIALGLICKPQLLILDEATTALDMITQAQLLEEILQLEKTIELTRIMITHDLSVVKQTCKQVAVMYAGHLVEEGPVPSVFTMPQHPYTKSLIEAYPSLYKQKAALHGLGGTLPNMTLPFKGCAFADRCQYAVSICRMQKPPCNQRKNGGTFYCHLEANAHG